MDEKQRRDMVLKLKKYETLNMELKHMREMRRDLLKGSALRQLNVFGANMSDSVYVPDTEFRSRLKEAIQLEVENEILRLETELNNL